MRTIIRSLQITILLFSLLNYAQTAVIKGVILNENHQPVFNVIVKSNQQQTTTNENGFYFLTFDVNEINTIVFTHISYKSITLTRKFSKYESFEFNPIVNNQHEQIGEIVIVNNKKRLEGITNIPPNTIRKIPGANPGVENILRTLGGVSGNNEMSTQYSVRGGNYDENLVYVNEIEIYRPFLIRSGQQEGLSFTNSDLTQNVDFSAGGFQAKYGDKLSSVLDITYKTPKKFGLTAEASFLGGSLTLEGVSPNQKWTGIIGARYRDNSLLVNSQETQTNYRPTYTDIQSYFTYTPSTRWQWSFLGNISQNIYNYQPLTRQTNFGTINEPIALVVFYEGQEKDRYRTYFGAIKSTFRASDNFKLKFISSAYHATEQEYFDILAQYRLGEVDSNIGSKDFGKVTFTRGIGSQLNHARNDLDALIINAEIKGENKLNNNEFEWGIKYTREDIRDRMVEWEVIDSAGYFINPPKIYPKNDQPHSPYYGPLVPYNNVRKQNYVTINRTSGYLQWSKKSQIGTNEVWYNAGVRAHQWQVMGNDFADSKNQITLSPRAAIAIKPNWKQDMIFKFATGLYHQPPSYRELRNFEGNINQNTKAQQSIHFILTNDYSFKMWQRPFKLVSEIYYKTMTNVNPYTLENVRIRYAAENNAKAYAQGFDMRLNGEFVPGTESWFTFGYLQTEENINNQGFISRPTDQLFKFGILFQDYMPQFPSLKLYLNLVYNTGLPGGSPSYANPYDYQLRLKDYRRADVGFSYVLTDKNAQRPDNHWLKKYQDFSIGFEIFNLFDNQNAITNTWVRDIYTKSQYGVPNYLTTRVFNLKLSLKI